MSPRFLKYQQETAAKSRQRKFINIDWLKNVVHPLSQVRENSAGESALELASDHCL